MRDDETDLQGPGPHAGTILIGLVVAGYAAWYVAYVLLVLQPVWLVVVCGTVGGLAGVLEEPRLWRAIIMTFLAGVLILVEITFSPEVGHWEIYAVSVAVGYCAASLVNGVAGLFRVKIPAE